MRDYLGKFLTGPSKNVGALTEGNRQNRQKVDGTGGKKRAGAYKTAPTQPTEATQTGQEGASVGCVGDPLQERVVFSAASEPPASFENTQRGKGSKGSKGTFDTFDTSPLEGFSDFQRGSAASPAAVANENVEMHDSALVIGEVIETCPICGATVQEERGRYFRHLWCPTPGHFDAWRAPIGGKLSNTDAPIIRERGRG